MQSRSRSDVLLLVHYWFPALTAWALTMAVASDAGIAADHSGAGLAAAGTGAIYSLDRIDGSQPRWLTVVLAIAVVVGCGFCLALLLQADARRWLVLLGVGASGAAHRWLKRWVPKNVVVSLAWTAMVCECAGLTSPHPLLLAALALQLWAACLLCDVKDADEDARLGIMTVASLIGDRGRIPAAAAALVLSTILARLADCPLTALGSAGTAGLCLLPCILARPVLGPLLVDLALALPGLAAVSLSRVR